MKFELLRMLVVYTHLIVCCVAIGSVVLSDMRFVRRLLRGEHTVKADHLAELQTIVVWSLSLLWLSGMLLVGMDVGKNGTTVLLNPKLQAKVLIVALLTMNGYVLHKHILPAVMQVACVLHLHFTRLQVTLFCGTVSAVSWLTAALLGVGKPLNWVFSLGEILFLYPVAIVAGYGGMVALIALSGRWNQLKDES